jgi:hypothetical protein
MTLTINVQNGPQIANIQNYSEAPPGIGDLMTDGGQVRKVIERRFDFTPTGLQVDLLCDLIRKRAADFVTLEVL